MIWRLPAHPGASAVVEAARDITGYDVGGRPTLPQSMGKVLRRPSVERQERFPPSLAGGA